MRMGRTPTKSVYCHTSSFLSCFLKEASNALTSGCIMAIFPPKLLWNTSAMFYTFQGKLVFKFLSPSILYDM